ncbi:hypothetical protein AB0H83_50560 [Dactylosporangium sp. NPDC050688]|uniref:hypothetical protein n=1 Tax=Dactylosporangium sp. NPDC050688 TaxID=3157217 RepID=UPI0033CA5F7F
MATPGDHRTVPPFHLVTAGSDMARLCAETCIEITAGYPLRELVTPTATSSDLFRNDLTDLVGAATAGGATDWCDDRSAVACSLADRASPMCGQARSIRVMPAAVVLLAAVLLVLTVLAVVAGAVAAHRRHLTAPGPATAAATSPAAGTERRNGSTETPTTATAATAAASASAVKGPNP